MNLILLEPGEVAHGRAVVRDRRGAHVCRVLRAAPGDRVRVGVIGGRSGTAEVLRADGDIAELALALDRPPCPRPRVDLILALPRPAVLGRALRTAAALGVGRIDLVNAWRVDKSHFQTKRLAPDALRAALILGCEQGVTTHVPELTVHRLLMPFLRGPARDLVGDIALIAHPRATLAIERAYAQAGSRERVTVAIGPERGWIEREVDSFADLGFMPVALGDRVLPVDTAIAAALAQLALLARL